MANWHHPKLHMSRTEVEEGTKLHLSRNVWASPCQVQSSQSRKRRNGHDDRSRNGEDKQRERGPCSIHVTLPSICDLALHFWSDAAVLKRLLFEHADLKLLFRLLLQLNDAYEEVDEQRQSVASWKRKAQKAQGEANDIRNSIVVGLSLARRLFVSISWGPTLIEGGLHVLRS